MCAASRCDTSEALQQLEVQILRHDAVLDLPPTPAADGRAPERTRKILTVLFCDVTQALWRQVQARVDASRGHGARAEELARAAVAITERTDSLNQQAAALRDLAEVLQGAGQVDEAVATLTQALERYERKLNLAEAAQTRDRMAELRG